MLLSLYVYTILLNMYKNVSFDTSRFIIHGYPIRGFDERNAEAARRVYAMVTNIDYDVGILLKKINNLQLGGKTIIIFLSDNGPQQVRYTAGLRGRKGSVYEGGIKVPFFIRYPGVTSEDTVIATPAAHIDLFPTLADLCHLRNPGSLPLDGKDLTPLLKGQTPSWLNRTLFFYWQRGYPEPYRNIAVRKGKYKLVGHAGYLAPLNDFELFDMDADPYERNNLSLEKPEVITELKQEFDHWYEKVINNPHLINPPRYIIGTDHQDTVILNRNDAKGMPGIWAQDQIYGFWDIAVNDPGPYTISFTFRHKLPTPGSLTFKAGTIQRTVLNKDSTLLTITCPHILLSAGNARFDSWYNAKRSTFYKGGIIMPFYVTIIKEK